MVIVIVLDKFHFKSVQQLVYLFFGIFHIRYDVLDMIRCSISAVSVIIYPQVGFIIGVKALVILFLIGYKRMVSSFSISTLKLKSCPYLV